MRKKLYTTPEEKNVSTVSDLFVPYGESGTISDSVLHKVSKLGMKKSIADNIASKLGMNMYDFAPLLHISSRTLSRYSNDTIMDTNATEHLLLLDALLDEGTEAFGTIEDFRKWLYSEVRALDFEKPISYLDTIFGIQIIKDMVGRIKYGVY
jgi:putative toxin-antitoxin system antitoxin component (TIGR02293 family)